MLRELTLLMFASNLKELHVGADQLEDIINKEKACEGGESGIVPFAKLVSLSWESTGAKEYLLESSTLSMSKGIQCNECPNLKKLPLDSQSGHGENGLVLIQRGKLD
ncbi:unnamed protein product [Microthlaspi erraticum]|uniref:Uncharacterized protein n=1 Tax=Microthlaspi erraticum TaxID=1685480 RepID=A0A6D2I4T8_9BRAS|nr:unnamed protein product [Microthlaspi erraticum]